jgi:hypothetical protein
MSVVKGEQADALPGHWREDSQERPYFFHRCITRAAAAHIQHRANLAREIARFPFAKIVEPINQRRPRSLQSASILARTPFICWASISALQLFSS